MGDNMKGTLFSVGECYPQWKTGQEGFCLEWKQEGFFLYAMINGVTEQEKEQFAGQQKITVRYTIIDDVCYFTFLFGGMAWADCPFSPTIYRTEGQEISFPDIKDGEGLAVMVLLIDTKTGELCRIRLIGLGNAFSVKWIDWAKKALEKPLTFDEYNKQVDETYLHYSSVDLAVKGEQEHNQYVIN